MSGDIDMAVAEQFRTHLVNIGKDVQELITITRFFCLILLRLLLQCQERLINNAI